MFRPNSATKTYQEKYDAFHKKYQLNIDINEIEAQLGLNTEQHRSLLQETIRNLTTELNRFMNELEKEPPEAEMANRVKTAKKQHELAIQQLGILFASSEKDIKQDIKKDIQHIKLVINTLKETSNSFFKQLDDFVLENKQKYSSYEAKKAPEDQRHWKVKEKDTPKDTPVVIHRNPTPGKN